MPSVVFRQQKDKRKRDTIPRGSEEKASRREDGELLCFSSESEHGRTKPPSFTDAEAGSEEGESGDCPFILPRGTPSWMITLPNDNDDDCNGEAAAAADDDDNDDEGR